MLFNQLSQLQAKRHRKRRIRTIRSAKSPFHYHQFVTERTIRKNLRLPDSIFLTSIPVFPVFLTLKTCHARREIFSPKIAIFPQF